MNRTNFLLKKEQEDNMDDIDAPVPFDNEPHFGKGNLIIINAYLKCLIC